eukprot:scaffold2422_cov56-Attheya_sp.AAC.14
MRTKILLPYTEYADQDHNGSSAVHHQFVELISCGGKVDVPEFVSSSSSSRPCFNSGGSGTPSIDVRLSLSVTQQNPLTGQFRTPDPDEFAPKDFGVKFLIWIQELHFGVFSCLYVIFDRYPTETCNGDSMRVK